MNAKTATCSDCGPLDAVIKRSAEPGAKPVWCCPWCGCPVELMAVRV
jgi:hypothetical protein